jgi:hypothetical protein
MGLLVVLVPADRDDLTLGPPAIEALARLGVTSVALAREARTLQPIVQMAVTAAATEGEVLE